MGKGLQRLLLFAFVSFFTTLVIYTTGCGASYSGNAVDMEQKDQGGGSDLKAVPMFDALPPVEDLTPWMTPLYVRCDYRIFEAAQNGGGSVYDEMFEAVLTDRVWLECLTSRTQQFNNWQDDGIGYFSKRAVEELEILNNGVAGLYTVFESKDGNGNIVTLMVTPLNGAWQPGVLDIDWSDIVIEADSKGRQGPFVGCLVRQAQVMITATADRVKQHNPLICQ